MILLLKYFNIFLPPPAYSCFLFHFSSLVEGFYYKMATPVSVEPPPMAHLRTGSEQEKDFQEKLKLMINLQYHEQQLSEEEHLIQEGRLPGKGATEIEKTDSIGMGQKMESQHGNLMTMGTTATPTPWPSQRPLLPPLSPQAGVGLGTLYFSKDLKSGFSDNQNSPSSGYGAVTQQQQQQQQHDFYYGNPDYHYPYDDVLNDSPNKKSKKSLCEKICCLYTPLMNLLDQEQLRRSFCYGAIDGK